VEAFFRTIIEYSMSKTDLDSAITTVITGFQHNVDDVFALMNFDRTVLDFSIVTLDTLDKQLKKTHSPLTSVEGHLQALKNIRQNDSMRANYTTIFNQCVVLLVSYFGSSVKDLFIGAVGHCIETSGNEELLEEEVKLTVRELRSVQTGSATAIGEFLAEHKDLTFQDLNSIHRAFQKYFGVQPRRDTLANELATAQACRNAIVHSGSRADDRLLRQIGHLRPRTIKEDLKAGQVIQFSSAEVEQIANTMKTYLTDLCASVAKTLASK
jgi:hypothetical protein